MSANKKDACETYVEQTKMLVSLASLFVFAPIGLMSVNDAFALRLSHHLGLAWTAELLFVAAVLWGYLTLGSLAGSQDDGSYDVYCPATRLLSILSIVCYLARARALSTTKAVPGGMPSPGLEGGRGLPPSKR